MVKMGELTWQQLESYKLAVKFAPRKRISPLRQALMNILSSEDARYQSHEYQNA